MAARWAAPSRLQDTYSGATASQLSFSVNTVTGAISNITLQGSTGTYHFTTTAFTVAATQYLAFYAPYQTAVFFAGLTVQSSTAGGAPVITSTLTATGAGLRFDYQITAINNPTSYGATGLPDGLTVNTATGLISGTATGTATVTTTNDVTISAANASGTGSATLVLTMLPPAPTVSSTLSATGTYGEAFSYQITGSDGPNVFNATGLPSTLSVVAATGLMSGTPTTTGTSYVTISAGSRAAQGAPRWSLRLSAAAREGAAARKPRLSGSTISSIPLGPPFMTTRMEATAFIPR